MMDPQGSFLCKIFQKECVGPKGIGVHEVGSEDLDRDQYESKFVVLSVNPFPPSCELFMAFKWSLR